MLIAAEIESADDERIGFDRFSGLAICLILFFFVGGRFAINEKIFRAEKPDALCATGLHAFCIGGLLDVRGDEDAMIVEGDGGLLEGVAKFFLERNLFTHQHTVFKQRLIGGVDDEDAVEAIEQRVIPVLQQFARVLQPDHCRDAKGARHDGRVGGAATDVRRESENILAIHLRGLRRSEIVRDDDAWLGELPQINGVGLAKKMPHHPCADIAHVRGAFAEIFILNLGERGTITLGDGVERVFCVDLFLFDHAHDFVNQRRIFQHEQVRVEDAGLTGAETLGELALNFLKLLACLDERVLESAYLAGDFCVRDGALLDSVMRLIENEDLTFAHASGHRDAPEDRLTSV